jgi:hypothetical protein
LKCSISYRSGREGRGAGTNGEASRSDEGDAEEEDLLARDGAVHDLGIVPKGCGVCLWGYLEAEKGEEEREKLGLADRRKGRRRRTTTATGSDEGSESACGLSWR